MASWRFGTFAVAALLSSLSFAALASADYFTDSRVTADKPNFRIRIKTRGNQIPWIFYRGSMRCMDPNPEEEVNFSDGPLDNPIQIRASGRFRQVERVRSDRLAVSNGVVGRIREGKIFGHLHFRIFDHRGYPYGPPRRCWTGRSWKDPWVHFVAQRRRHR